MRLSNLLNRTFLLILTVALIISCQDIEEIEQGNNRPQLTIGKLDFRNSESGRTDAVIVTPYAGTYYAGDNMAIQWSVMSCTCGDWISNNINIDLYKGQIYIGRIASNVPFVDANYNSQYIWTIPSLASTGSDYLVRISNTQNSSQFAESSYFSLVTPSGNCYNSFWSLSGAPNGYVMSGTTVQYTINEIGITQLASANSPSMKVSSYGPINIIYNGTTYYSSGSSGVIIPINGTLNCSSNNPVISAPMTFQKIGSGTTVIVTLNSVSQGHMYSHGYHSFSVY